MTSKRVWTLKLERVLNHAPSDILQLIWGTWPILHTQSRLARDWLEWTSGHHIFISQYFVSMQNTVKIYQ